MEMSCDVCAVRDIFEMACEVLEECAGQIVKIMVVHRLPDIVVPFFKLLVLCWYMGVRVFSEK